MIMQGQARDLLTPSDGGAPLVLAEDCYTILASPRREILSIEVSPDRPEAQQLIGIRAGSDSRSALIRIMAEERRKGSPLYLILDDFAGASLVAGWVWSRWVDDWAALMQKSGARSSSGRRASMESVCSGFAPGSSALASAGGSRTEDQNCMPVPTLVHPEDPNGWHSIVVQEGVGMRRARRIDVWRDGDALEIDIGFQDSGTAPNSKDRIAIHEYHVRARAEQGRLTELVVDPRILPFRECPGAVAHAQRMLGAPLHELRTQVLENLHGILGCTHLNDVLRSMAEVPHMASALHE
ncbi:DUF2889 domain-containing protein [Blastomonas sp.]|uniref:DUF2889 domain-containing protein n=1 Tax=Blastomonas sp. TaxID=1909299 RepID=UPI0026153E17|nr:DUF2889 domain-containing protein [Blastomonas sp.]MDM7957645.1 DUF2889 domain-containing protein [Blastomonas sp.]